MGRWRGGGGGVDKGSVLQSGSRRSQESSQETEPLTGRPSHPLCIARCSTSSGAVHPKWLEIAAGLPVVNLPRTWKCLVCWDGEGGEQSQATNLIILTHCNTTKNILERFYCLLRVFEGKSRRRSSFSSPLNSRQLQWE